MASTKDVLDHHLKCFGEGDLEGILSDYARSAVMFTADGPLKGADAIRPLFQAMVAEFGKPGATFTMKQQFVEGNMPTFCGAQRLPTTCTSWAPTRSSFGTARSWPSHSPARLRQRAEKTP
jgi:ketosteroid isomerase-like protein